MKTDQGVAEVQYGTLDVAVASRKAIVVATDSRRSGYDEARTDDTKKLFLLPGDRVVAIAGLVDASLPKFPEITAQIPALLEQAIGHCGHLDMFFWEDPPPPADSPEEFHHLWGSDPFVWLSAIVGPIQTVFNIAATYSPVDLSRATMDVIVAGYRQSGEVKLVRSRLQPLESTPRGGRRFIGVARHHERVAPVDGFAATTIGAGNLANALLFEAVPVDFIPELSSYPGIEAFLERRDSGDLAEMPEDDLIALAHDLIRATAASNRGVGSEPLQTAVLRFGQRVAYDQPKRRRERRGGAERRREERTSWHLSAFPLRSPRLCGEDGSCIS